MAMIPVSSKARFGTAGECRVAQKQMEVAVLRMLFAMGVIVVLRDRLPVIHIVFRVMIHFVERALIPEYLTNNVQAAFFSVRGSIRESHRLQ